MDDDFIARLDAEEAALEAKLAAVRHMKAVYGAAPRSGNLSPSVRSSTPRATRSQADRLDKFGSYGQQVIDAAMEILPGEDGTPMATRVVLEKLEFRGVEVRGANKINALSALLARSTKIKGHGRSGWTLYGRAPLDLEAEELLGSPAPIENEPHSASAGGPYTDHSPVRTGPVITSSTPSWPSITS